MIKVSNLHSIWNAWHGTIQMFEIYSSPIHGQVFGMSQPLIMNYYACFTTRLILTKDKSSSKATYSKVFNRYYCVYL